MSQKIGPREVGPREIVIAADAPPAVRYAAEEFQRLFAEAAGSKLPIVHADSAGVARRVYIGPSAALAASGVALKTGGLGEEDLRYVARGGDVAIVGGSPRGTLYGVYTFLEDVLGVRFLTPDHTHVPKLDAASFAGPEERTFQPVFRYRGVYFHDTLADHAFSARLRNNGFANEPQYGGANGVGFVGHSLFRFVNSSKYGREHPEYFALVDGKRLWKPAGLDETTQGTQLCLTNPDVRRLVVAGAVQDAKQHPDWQVVSVAQNDNKFYCRCPNCEAVHQREGSPMGTLLQVVNEAADAVAHVNPKTLVGTYAYQYTRRPPKHLRPRDNVLIQLPTIEGCQMHALADGHCPIGRAIVDDIRGWSRLTPRLYIWSYYTLFPDYLLPNPDLRTIEPNVRLFRDCGARGAFMQGAGMATASDLGELRTYVISGLMWDPTRSGDALAEEFIRLHYGSAAPAMRKYVQLVSNPERLRKLHNHPFGTPDKYGVTPQFATECLAIFDEALAAAGNDATLRRRVEKASLAAHRATIVPAYQAARTAGKLSADEARRLKPAVERFCALCRKYEITEVGENFPWSDERDILIDLFQTAGVPLKAEHNKAKP